MKKKITRIILVVILVLTLGGLSAKFFELLAAGRNGFQTFLQVLEILKTHYVKKNLDETKLYYGAIKGMLYALDDPYTRFLEPKAFSEMKIRMNGSFGGIGIQIGMKNDLLTVIAPMEGTPAWKAGLIAMDQILAIDGQSTLHMSIEEAVQKIRGSKGSKVKLTIYRKSFKKPKDFEIVRDIINIEDVKSSVINKNIGYLRIITFESEKTTEHISRALEQFKKQGVQKLIIDVRNNGGGLLQNALDISSFFLEKNLPIVSTIDREGRKETFYSDGKTWAQMPMVVLANEGSASASEILAGALQDNKMAKVVGRKSFGKASVQTIRPLWDGSALLYTVAKYLTPSGRDITEKGIEPDFLINGGKKDLEKDRDLPEEEYQMPLWPPDLKKDVFLQKALELLGEKISLIIPEKSLVFLDTSGHFPYIKENFLKLKTG